MGWKGKGSGERRDQTGKSWGMGLASRMMRCRALTRPQANAFSLGQENPIESVNARNQGPGVGVRGPIKPPWPRGCSLKRQVCRLHARNRVRGWPVSAPFGAYLALGARFKMTADRGGGATQRPRDGGVLGQKLCPSDVRPMQLGHVCM